DLYEYYRSLLKEDQIDIYILGDLDKAYMEELVGESFQRDQISQRTESKDEQLNKKKEPQEVIEKQNVQQAKLHIGYRTNITYKDDNYPALQVFNGILGGFPSSKLFINVREKNSLAY